MVKLPYPTFFEPYLKNWGIFYVEILSDIDRNSVCI